MKIRNNKIIFKLILIIFFLNLPSCGLKIVDNHGQIFDENIQFDDFKVGATTKDDLLNILGSPSTKSSFDGEKSWYYISSEFKKFVFLDGTNTDQRILVFRFNDNNTLNEKKLLSKDDINEIDHEITITDSRGRELVWYKSFLKNLNPNPFGNNQ